MFHQNDHAAEGGWPEHYAEDIATFMASVEDHPRGLWVCDDVFASALFPLQRKREMQAMLDMAGSLKPRIVGEIGSDKGGSLYHWCNIPSVQRVVAIEYRGIPFRKEFERAFPDIDFCFIHGSSFNEENVEVVRQWLGDDKMDCVFLDGDKSFFDKDFDCYSPLVRKGGLVFMHDINGPGNPRETFDKLSETLATASVIDTTEYLDILRNPPTNQTSWEQWLGYWKTTSCGVGVVLVQ